MDSTVSARMSTGLDASPAWIALSAHFDNIKDVTMKDMFASDPERFNKFHLEFEELMFDFSKNRINEETMKLLYALAAQQDVNGLAKKMFSGEKISEFILCVGPSYLFRLPNVLVRWSSLT